MLRQHAHVSHLPLSGARIAGTSAAIALHAIVLMLLFMPSTWAPPKVDVAEDSPAINVEIPKIREMVVVNTKKPEIRTTQPTHTAPITKPVETQDVVVPSNTGQQVAVVDNARPDVGPTDPPSIAVAEISADVAPAPPYPALALRAGTTGLVILRINVDAHGHPLDGRIEKSSGSRLLDESALKFVLAKWHFNPAMQAGQPVSAVALVPIEFSLD